MERLGSKPIEQVILKDHVKNAMMTAYGWAMELSWDRPVKNLIVSSRGVSMSLESSKLYITYFNMVPSDSMDDAWKQVYRSMYGMASILEWSGILRKTPRIVTSPSLNRMKEILRDLEVSDKLADTLNADEGFMALLSDVKPDKFSAEVSAVSAQAAEPFHIQAMRSFTNPPELTFVFLVEKLMSRGIGYEKKFMRIIDLFERAIVLTSKLADGLRSETLSSKEQV